MFALGMAGHMRRLYDPTKYEFLHPFQPTNEFVTKCAIWLLVVQVPFIVNFFWSLWKDERAEANPWNATTLEWALAPSPPPHGNFETIPTVHRGPYEYSSPEAAADFLPQHEELAKA
jgi:cytochrome c oxidase subunit 1